MDWLMNNWDLIAWIIGAVMALGTAVDGAFARRNKPAWLDVLLRFTSLLGPIKAIRPKKTTLKIAPIILLFGLANCAGMTWQQKALTSLDIAAKVADSAYDIAAAIERARCSALVDACIDEGDNKCQLLLDCQETEQLILSYAADAIAAIEIAQQLIEENNEDGYNRVLAEIQAMIKKIQDRVAK
jgi:hypothetical protein